MVGERIFKEGDRLEPYYVAAYAAYRLEFLFGDVPLTVEIGDVDTAWLRG
jgi:hypothetical protein